MITSPSMFDDWLTGRLEQSAREAGEDVATYVARAVGSRMLADQQAIGSAAAAEIQSRLAAAGVFGEGMMATGLTAVTDPARVRALHATGLLDSPPEEVYDRITRAAAAALDAPLAALTLIDVDRQYFKSTVGMKVQTPAQRQTPLDRSLCQYAVASGSPLVLDNAHLDPMLKNNPAVRDGTVSAYIGIPLIDGGGHAIGTLCVFDTHPRQWSTGHVQVLSDLAKIASERIFGPGAVPGI